MLLKLRPDCTQLIRQHQRQSHPCFQTSTTSTSTSTSASTKEITPLESRLEDDFYYDEDDDEASRSRLRHHPHEDFEPHYDEEHEADGHHSQGRFGGHNYDEGGYHHHRPKKHRPKKHNHKRNLHKAPFYGEIAGYDPPQGVILNIKDTTDLPELEPGGLAAITPKFMKFLRGHVLNVGKKKKKKLSP
jgi:hypothetical protein